MRNSVGRDVLKKRQIKIYICVCVCVCVCVCKIEENKNALVYIVPNKKIMVVLF